MDKMKSIKNIFLIFVILLIIIYIFYYLYRVLYKTEETFSLEMDLNTDYDENIEHYENIDYQNYTNIISNGTFENGKDVGGYMDQSGVNKIVEKKNPSSSKYVLQQEDTRDLTYYNIVQPVMKNSLYVFMMWVHLENPISDKHDFSKLLRVRILTESGSNEIPVIKSSIERESTLNSSKKWYLIKYTFSTSNQVKNNMNIYINYTNELIAKNIYYANISLFKVLNDVPDFIFTNGLTTFISGLYCENGVISWRDLGVLGNNFALKNRAVVDSKEGFVNMYNNVAKQMNGNQLFSTSPMFMINLLTLIDSKDMNENETFSILSIFDNSDKPIIELNISKDNNITLQCKDLSQKSTSSLILTNKTLLSLAFNNDLHTLVFYQDCVPMIRIENCPTLYFDKCKFILNQKQYLKMNVYDCMVHNYVLLEKEHKDLRTYLMNSAQRSSSTKTSLFDYVIPKFDSNTKSEDLENDDVSDKDDFKKTFHSSEQVYTNVKKDSCNKPIEVKPSDCPTAYKKGDEYFIFIPKNSYYHNKLGYYGEKLYGNDKSKVRYIYQMNFPECELPIILTENEGGKYANTCPFIIEKNNPCGMVGCGNVDWNKEYVEDLGLDDKCKNAVSYYCRSNYDLDPKCVAWKPENKYDVPSIHIRNYFESPDEYCDVSRFNIEQHPDFKDYIRKDQIPCWGCDLKDD